MDPYKNEGRFLSSLASSGQFKRLAAYLSSNEAINIRRKAAGYLAQSVDSLSEQDTAALAEKLHEAALTETDDTVRARIVETLVYIDDAAIDTLVQKIESYDAPTPTDSPHPLLYTQWLDSSHVELRLLAVAGLGSVGSKQVVPKLAAACNDQDDRIRIRAIEECGQLGDPRCVEVVTDCLDASNIEVRTAAARALTRIGTDDSLTTIMPLAKDGDPDVRQAIIEEIGTVGSIVVLGVLLKALVHDNEQFRKTAIRSTIELMVHAPTENSDIIRRTVGIQLQQSPDRDLVPDIQAISKAERPEIRRNAIWLLGDLLDPTTHTDGLQTLIRAVGDPDTTTAKIAVSQLVKLNDSRIIDHLEDFIRTTEVDSATLQRADYIREQITKKTADDHLKNAVEYTKISDPSDYTKKHAEDS